MNKTLIQTEVKQSVVEDFQFILTFFSSSIFFENGELLSP